MTHWWLFWLLFLVFWGLNVWERYDPKLEEVRASRPPHQLGQLRDLLLAIIIIYLANIYRVLS